MSQYDLDEFQKQTRSDIDIAFEEESKNQIELDKAILTLSASTLALSVTFVKDIAPKPLPNSIWMLFLSWLTLIASVVVVLLSFRFAVGAHRETQEYHVERLKAIVDGKPDINFTSKLSMRVGFANSAALVLFCIGVVLFTSFVGFNYYINMSNSESGQSNSTNKPTIVEKGTKPAVIKPVPAKPDSGKK